MNKSNHSYAINRKITEIFNNDSWLGKRCFIIGGGESLKGFDFNILNDEYTIGINKAFQFYPNIKVLYIMDSDFYNGMKDGRYDKPNQPKIWDIWMSFKGVRVFLTPMELKEFGKEAVLVRRIMRPSVSRDLDYGIYGGRNSGLGAIMLAIALGASPIYLLGYDMKAVTQSHWHDGYPNRSLGEFNQKLVEYRDEITNMMSLINQAKVQIINLNPDSELRCFPFSDIDTVLRGQLEPKI